MQYFDEAFPDHCGSCDVCLSEIEKFDGTLIAQKALSAVSRLKERFGNTYVIDFLRGSKREKIKEEHKQLKTYGVGADIHRADWFRYIRELVAQGYLQLTDDEYPVLKLTEKSDAVLKGLQKVELIATQTTEERQYEAIPYEAELLNRLKTTRRDIAAKENVPAYIILSDATLLEMATYLPQSKDELLMISGFGEVKLAKYGDVFLQTVKTYCGEWNLSSKIKHKIPKRERKTRTERTNTSRRSADNTRTESFSMFRSGKTVESIAAERGLSPMTIEGHLSYFVQIPGKWMYRNW